MKRYTADELNNSLQRQHDFDMLDLRPVSEFLDQSIPGSISLPMDEEQFVGNLRKIWPHPKNLVLVTSDENVLDKVLDAVREVGGRVIGYVILNDWLSRGYPTNRIESVEVDELLADSQRYSLVDVRLNEEWRKQHIPHSINVPLATIDNSSPMLDRNGEHVAFCAGIYRGIAGAAKLSAQGYKVKYLPGGVSAWYQKTNQ